MALFFLFIRNHFRIPSSSSLIRGTRRPSRFSNGGIIKPFSTTSTSQSENDGDPKKTSLSARMSFVFDQIDAIEKERSNKDDALQRIRAWRETKKKKEDDSSEMRVLEVEEVKEKKGNLFNKEIEMVHPWPEWIELMERLVQQNYFDHRRTNEDKIVQNLPIDLSEFDDDGFDFTRDWTTVRTACLNFGRDRFDILRSLSRQDIQILVGHGCPSVDNKVVFSAKLLRKHVHLDEGDVCSSCSLRNSCDRAYLVARKEDEARTLDVMRTLLTFGFDPVNGSVENKALMKMKSVKTVVRKLLHEVVKLSAVPIDPNLPPPVIKKPPPKVKQPPPVSKKRVGRDDIEMKKGDWLCPKCDFMNFAKNTVCLQCDVKRPKRQLLPGEWECPECNFLNYRRNMACFHCDHKRPPDEFTENQTHARSHGPRTRLERVSNIPGVDNSWNFDFDDNESDGADVAAFEFADSPRMGEESSNQEGGSFRGFEDDSPRTNRMPRAQERGSYADHDQRKPTTGFDDFDDEEDDDVNSYELVTSNNNSIQEVSSKVSEVEDFSGSEDFDSSYNSPGRRGSNFHARSQNGGHDFDSDEELSARHNWKSSHMADTGNGTRVRGGPYRGIKFDSDDEFEADSGSDNDKKQGFGPKHRQRTKWSSNRKDSRRGESSDSEGGIGFGSESDDDDFPSTRNKTRGNKSGPDRGGSTSRGRGRGQFTSGRDAQFRPNRMMSDRRNSFDTGDDDGSFRGSNRNDRGSQGGGYRGGRGSDRRSNGDGYRGERGSDRGSNGDGYRGERGSDRGSNGDGYRGGRGSDRGSNGDGYRGGRGNNRGSHRDGFRGGRGNDRQGSSRNFGRPGQDTGFGYQQRGRSNDFNDRSEMGRDFGDDRPRKRIIER